MSDQQEPMDGSTQAQSEEGTPLVRPRALSALKEAYETNPVTQFVRNSPFLVISLVVHLLVLFLLALVTAREAKAPATRTVLSLEDLPDEELEIQPLTKPPDPSAAAAGGGGAIGGGSGETSSAVAGSATAVAIAPIQVLGIESPVGGGGAGDFEHRGSGGFNIAIAGGQGGEKSIGSAVDQFAAVTLSSMTRGKTLVALLVDQSRSVIYGDLPRMVERLNHYFDEIERNLPASLEERGRWVVVSFGRTAKFRCQPSPDIGYLKAKLAEVEVDESGVENIGAATELVLNQFGGQNRKFKYLLIAAITDEAGDDIINHVLLERLIKRLRAERARFYVFGYESTFCARNKYVTLKLDPELLKGKDRDAIRGFEGQTTWGFAVGGPESPMPELWWGGNWWHWQTWGGSMHGITSGFGMYGLNRMVLATGGIYFLLKVESKYNEDKLYTLYKPDICSVPQYLKRVRDSKLKRELAEAWNEIGQYYMPHDLRNIRQVQSCLDKSLVGRDYCKGRAIQLQRLLASTKLEGHNYKRWEAHADLTLAELLRFRFMLGQYHEVLRRWMNDDGTIPEKKRLVMSRGKVPGDYVGPVQAKQEYDMALQQIQLLIDKHKDTPWEKMGQRLKQNLFPWKCSITDIPKGGPSPPGLAF